MYFCQFEKKISEIVQTKTKYSVMNIPKYMEALGGRLLNRFD